MQDVQRSHLSRAATARVSETGIPQEIGKDSDTALIPDGKDGGAGVQGNGVYPGPEITGLGKQVGNF